MIYKVKSLIGVNDDSIDEKIQFYIDFTIDYVKSYCQIDDIPDELVNTICMLCAKFYNNYGSYKSISMGDVSFSQSETFLEFKSILNKFRKVGF